MIQPCSNQVAPLIQGQNNTIDVGRPSVTQGGTNPGSQRSPRGQIKGQFYAVHGRGMSIQNNTDPNSAQAKGILTKIFKNQQNRAAAFQHQNYIDHLS